MTRCQVQCYGHSIDGRPVVKNIFLSAWCKKGKLYLYDFVARGEPNLDLLCKWHLFWQFSPSNLALFHFNQLGLLLTALRLLQLQVFERVLCEIFQNVAFFCQEGRKSVRNVSEEMKALSDGFAMIYSGAQLEVMPLFVLSLFTAAYLRDWEDFVQNLIRTTSLWCTGPTS